jgi:hypothetical protein
MKLKEAMPETSNGMAASPSLYNLLRNADLLG